VVESLKTEINLYGELTIFSRGGDILYRGKPQGFPVEKAVLSQNDAIIVLLKYEVKKYGDFENLLLLKPDGTALWYAQLPTSSGDAYVDFEVSNSKLFANSWSCYRVEIDVQTGKILQQDFTK
jgi:hypothetical protein